MTPTHTVLSSYNTGGAIGRYEVKIIGGTPTYYKDGVVVGTTSVIVTNPQLLYLDIGTAWDNIVVGETDHHITGSLPTNWSIQRDLIDPSATGVYAWNPATSKWVLKNSYYFYVDADKEFLNPETLSIRHIGGTVINATTLIPNRNVVQYSVADFLATSTAVGTTVPDGQYSLSWDSTSPPNWFADTFWVISNGGTVAWGQDRYTQESTATITYAMSTGYFVPATYTYALVVQDMYGEIKTTIPVNQQTGSTTVTLNSATYPAMVYNVLLQATKISDSTTYIMNYDSMEITGYVGLAGYVMNAENTTLLSGVSINVTQGTTSLIATSGPGGLWNSSGNWLTGSPLNIFATHAGYENYTNTFTPAIAKTLNITIPMMPINKTCVGVCLAGIVNESVYGNPVSGATVYSRNVTTDSTVTNMAGYYRFDNLISGNIYDVWSSKTGYSNSTVVPKLVVGV
jgi:hypothetical protein